MLAELSCIQTRGTFNSWDAVRRVFTAALDKGGIIKALRIPDGKRISNARVKPKGDIAGCHRHMILLRLLAMSLESFVLHGCKCVAHLDLGVLGLR
jgi:hypothetical protein